MPTPGEVVLSVENLVVKESRGLEAVKNLSLLDVHRGEVVGIAGIDGNGQSELIQALTGLRKVESGTVTIDGEDVTSKTPRQIAETGVGHVPEDRHKYGLSLRNDISRKYGITIILSRTAQQKWNLKLWRNQSLSKRVNRRIRRTDNE